MNICTNLNIPSVLAIIPARGGSKGIPQKNIISFCGKPLIAYTIIEAIESELISRTVVSTDSIEIADIARSYGAEVPFIRPDNLASDVTPALPVIKHAVQHMVDREHYTPDIIVLLQPTSPLRTKKHIDDALKLLIDNNADSIVSVTKVPHNCSPVSIMKIVDGFLEPFLESSDEQKQIRQQKPVYYARNGAAIYAFTYDCLMKKNSIYGDKILPFEMAKEDSFDVDDPVDLEITSYFLEKRLKQ